MVAQEKSENKREHDRVSDPSIRLKIGAKIYHSINWSLGGILIDGYEGGLSSGSLLSITEIGFQVTASKNGSRNAAQNSAPSRRESWGL